MQPIDSNSTLFLLLDITRILRLEFERKIQKAALGITPSEARTLANIARFGPLNQNKLSDLTGFGAMSAARVLKNLEAAGLVSRSADPNDRRAKIVQVTQKAAPLLTALKDVGEEVDAVTRGDMSLEDWTSLQSMLQKVRQTQLTAYRSRRTAEDTPE
ncbi:MarR family winged helix-turn-helix transcriptional regulator [Sulfitobacter sp. 1A13496]|uniref:MarR family winged helix-turn-helix transcriptional regulator n=1 Tax=unclassified Sulfitobacter TaxID=196795 RepID=UPI002AC948E3|nr:MarR family transcriptional regulator [Sulfitobacter sp. OXR-159]WPZ31842.1 MarR family transcriptional regulator [Sulfitobacter sp. OXR-159]